MIPSKQQFSPMDIAASIAAGATYVLLVTTANSYPFAAASIASFVGISVFRSGRTNSKILLLAVTLNAVLAFGLSQLLGAGAWLCGGVAFLATLGVLIKFGVVSNSEKLTSVSDFFGPGNSLLIAGVSIAVLLPAYFSPFHLIGHDAPIHEVWQAFYAEQLWRGNVLPRWLELHNDGLGSPAFFLYSPMSHWISALFVPLSPGYEGAPIRLVMSAALALFISGIGAQLWLRQVLNSNIAALIGAFAYVLAPYHLFSQIYYRAALGELWTMAWIPFGLWGILNLNSKAGMIALTLAAAANIFSNIATAIVVLPLYALYLWLVVFGKTASPFSRDVIEYVLRFAICMLLALLFVSPYLWVALTQIEHANMGEQLVGKFRISSSFLDVLAANVTSQLALLNTIGVFAFQALGVLVLLVFIWIKPVPQRVLLQSLFAALVTALVLFLNTSLSNGLWELFDLFKRLQFPWRLMVLQSVAFALTVGLAAERLGTVRSGSVLKGISAIFLIGLVAANGAFFAFNGYIEHRWGTRSPANINELLASPIEPAEYRLGDVTVIDQVFGPDKRQLEILSGEGIARIIDHEPRKWTISVDAKTTMQIAIRHYNYYGWVVSSKQLDFEHATQPLSQTVPVISFTVPAGNNKFELTLPKSNPERFSPLLSLLGLLLLAGVVARTKR